jgi:hypothetical protein
MMTLETVTLLFGSITLLALVSIPTGVTQNADFNVIQSLAQESFEALASITRLVVTWIIDDYLQRNMLIIMFASLSRILGGTKVQSRREVPWMARFLECRAWCRVTCGGALITKRHVVTAAQCFYRADDP